MVMNPEIKNPAFWDALSYEDKTAELIHISNNMGWTLEELSEQTDIPFNLLINLLSLQEEDDEKIKTALIKVTPMLEERLQEHHEGKNLEKEINQVTRQANVRHLSMNKLLGIDNETLNEWKIGTKEPSDLEKKVIKYLYVNFDEGIEILKILDNPKKEHQIKA